MEVAALAGVVVAGCGALAVFAPGNGGFCCAGVDAGGALWGGGVARSHGGTSVCADAPRVSVQSAIDSVATALARVDRTELLAVTSGSLTRENHGTARGEEQARTAQNARRRCDCSATGSRTGRGGAVDEAPRAQRFTSET